jgi:superfamily II DNA or RNA helicase
MVGRVLRPAEGKPDAVILDHSGGVYRHGLPEDHVEWTLAVDRRAVNPAQQKRDRGETPKLHECPSCKAVMVAPPCGACGWRPQPRGRAVDFEDGELGLVVGGTARASEYTEAARISFFQQLRSVQQTRSYKQGWTAHKFKDKFGHFPPRSYNDLPPAIPTDAVLRWVRSRNIAYAKARAA